MDPYLKCCVSRCHTRPNQGFRFYRFPCHNPQICSIWEQRISQSANIDFDILNDHICELHFDYRCKTGNECALEDGSLPTLHLPSFGSLYSTGNAHFHMSKLNCANRTEESSYTISADSLSYHCRFCLRRGLLYEVETSTYKSKSFLSLIDLPTEAFAANTHPNACLSCLKSIVIAHQLSTAVKQSTAILQLLLQHPKQSKVVSNTQFFYITSELAFCNLILANSPSIKLEFEIEDKIVWANEDYEQKLVGTKVPTLPAVYVNTQNIDEKFIYAAENQGSCQMHDSITSDEQCPKEFHKPFAIKKESTTELSVEGIPDVSENSDSCVLMKNTDDNAEVMVTNNSDDSCVEDRQFDNERAPESTIKAVNEPNFKCDLCKFSTNYKASLSIHKNRHLTGNDTVHFDCQKCARGFLLRRQFMRHNAIVHVDDFTCKICDKPHASATKLAVHYTEHHHFQCDISSRVSRRWCHAHMLDKQGQSIFTAKDKNTHWNDNDGVYDCPICIWNTPSTDSFNAHIGKYVKSDKNSTIGSQDLGTLILTDPARNVDGRFHCNEYREAFFQKQNFDPPKRMHTNERPYKCTKCLKTFILKQHFRRHERTHTNERPHKCTECSKSFTDKSSLNVHKRIHTNERPYQCSECLKSFSLKGTLDVHRKIHTNERPYKCTECLKAFRGKFAFMRHKRTHTNERPYKCTECLKSFSLKNTLDVHRKTHTNERPYKCTECLKTFSLKHHFRRHEKTHTNEGPFKCTECSKSFTDKSSLNVHKRIHTNERPYQCSECPNSFSQKGTLNVHKRIHTNERPYKCSECPKTFGNKSNYSVHRRIHTNERPYHQCTECPKTFCQKSSLDIHKRIHTNDRPYKCTQCPKTFSRKSCFNVHMRIHTNERPYKCSECPKAFSTKVNFYRHKRIHTNEKPYKCSECSQAFGDQSSFVRHIRTHTDDRPYKCQFCSGSYNRSQTLTRHVLSKHSDSKTLLFHV